jgi:polyhydroxyalkanoate synthesis repressor PhaR
MQRPEAPTVIKRYANRRLYNTETAAYVSLDDLAGMVRMNEAFVVRDAGNGEDVTPSILTLITSPTTEH